MVGHVLADDGGYNLNMFTQFNAKCAEAQEKNEQMKYGFDLYPERRGEKVKFSTIEILFGDGRAPLDKMRCEQNVYKCVKRSPLVKLMMNALKSSGCPFDIRRHVSCEICDTSVTGGYDQELNQVVICQNTCKSEGKVQGVLTHEMIHMFDYCRNDLDFKNIDHLACTEIRAANLAHCSFLSALFQGDASPFNIKATHQNCVKSKAAYSVMAVRGVDEATARRAIDKVFDKCYADLEPIGRRLKRNSGDIPKAYEEGFLYGYDDSS